MWTRMVPATWRARLTVRSSTHSPQEPRPTMAISITPSPPRVMAARRSQRQPQRTRQPGFPAQATILAVHMPKQVALARLLDLLAGKHPQRSVPTLDTLTRAVLTQRGP